MSDSNGCIYDPEGIRLDVVKDIKLRRRGRIREYAQLVPGSEYPQRLPGIVVRPLRRGPALRHPE